MMHKVAVAFFLSRMEECLTTPVTITGAHLMLYILETGLIVLIRVQTPPAKMVENVQSLETIVTVVSVPRDFMATVVKK